MGVVEGGWPESAGRLATRYEAPDADAIGPGAGSSGLVARCRAVRYRTHTHAHFESGDPLVPEESTSCASCGKALLPTDAFCSGCGIAVGDRGIDAGAERRTIIREAVPTAQRRHCPSCNAPLFAGDSFCAACGAEVTTDVAEVVLPESTARLKDRIEEASRGRYRIVREIGRGGMGVVFLAEDTDLARRVAIKVLSGGGSDPSTLERFEREARTVAQLRHEAIVRVHAVGNLDDLHYFVMDYVAGVSLQKILKSRGQLPLPMIEAVLFRVGVGLAYAHTQPHPVVHRDIKPSNILVDTHGQVTLMDFGVAKVGDDSIGLTRTGMILGTPEYMSPEQVRGHAVTPATDQYALGAVAFAMITGRPPFSGPFYQVLIAHQGEPIPDVRTLRDDLPEPFVAAVERMLAKDPADRWPDLPTLLRELDLRPLSPYDPTVKEMSELVTSLYHAEIEADAAASFGGFPSTASRLRIALQSDRVEVGDSVTLDVSLLFPDGKEEPARDLSWTTDPPGIVQFDSATGELVALAAGVTRLTAHGGDLDASIEVAVAAPQVDSVSIRPERVALEPGEVALLEGVTLSRSGRALDHPRTWASSDPSVVTVTPTGEIRAQKPGSASVVLYCDSGWAAVAVQVKEEAAPVASPPSPPPSSRASAPGAVVGVAAGDVGPAAGASEPAPKQESLESTAIRPPERGVITPRRRGGREAETSGPPVKVIAGAVGVVAVIAVAAMMMRGGGGGAADLPPAAGDLSVLMAGGGAVDQPIELAAGEAVDLDLRVPENLDAAGEVAWSSSDAGVAQVEDGRVTGVGPGVAEITASLGGATSVVRVEVPAVPVGLQLRTAAGAAPSGGRLTVAEGQSTALTGVLVDQQGTTIEGAPVTWTSSDPGVADYAAGAVRGEGPGAAVLTARSGDFESTVRVTVEATQAAPPSRPATPSPQPTTPPAAERTPPPAERAVTEAAPVTGRGTLLIVVTPGWANAFLDGQPIGEYKTNYELDLDAGSYQIRLENPAFAPADTTLTIRPGQVTRWERRLGTGSDS